MNEDTGKGAIAIISSLTLLLGRSPRWKPDGRLRLLGHATIIVLGLAGGFGGRNMDLWSAPSRPVAPVLAAVEEKSFSPEVTGQPANSSLLNGAASQGPVELTSAIFAYSGEEAPALGHQLQAIPTAIAMVQKEAPKPVPASPTPKPTTVPTTTPVPTKAVVQEAPKATAAPPPPASDASDIVALATKFIGTPYVWAGTTPQGFDCTGFVRYIYGQKGIELPRTVREQFAVGTAVERQALKPGDLVFFQNTFERGLSHVGIYIGNEQFISSASENRGVAVDDLNLPYWATRYVDARRL